MTNKQQLMISLHDSIKLHTKMKKVCQERDDVSGELFHETSIKLINVILDGLEDGNL